MSERAADHDLGAASSIRLDKWLWQARFFKSRTLATRFLEAGKARLRGAVVKSHIRVKVDDVVTFTLGGAVRIVRIAVLGTRRGPAAEARTLYDDLSPPRMHTKDSDTPDSAVRDPGAGRPTKAERRAIDRLRAPDEH